VRNEFHVHRTVWELVELGGRSEVPGLPMAESPEAGSLASREPPEAPERARLSEPIDGGVPDQLELGSPALGETVARSYWK
jgi:hypothetical protein